MVVIALDTHAVVKELQAAGFSEAQAEAVTRAVGRGQQLDISHLATRAELTAVRDELKGDIEVLRKEVEGLRKEVRADIDGLRKEVKTDIAELKVDLLKWVIGAVGFQTVALIGAVITVARILRG
jgi:phage host-nuclease inhibitor protein Gam